MNLIYTIIVTYNGIKWIEKCISSVSAESKVIVVDNASIDDTLNLISSNFPDVVILAQDKNLGFGEANNIGISYALNHGASGVFLLNQDAWISTGTINQLDLLAQKNKDFGVLSPIHFNGTGSALDHSFQILSSAELISDLVTRHYRCQIYKVSFINAAAWYIRKDVLLKIGGFDPIFFMYGEDVNYTQRLKYHGYKVGITPLLKIYHSSENNYYKNEVFGSKKFIAKHINKFYTTYGNVNISSNLGAFRYIFYVLRKSILNFLVFKLGVGCTYFRIWRILSVQSAIKLKSRGRVIGPQHLKILE